MWLVVHVKWTTLPSSLTSRVNVRFKGNWGEAETARRKLSRSYEAYIHREVYSASWSACKFLMILILIPLFQTCLIGRPKLLRREDLAGDGARAGNTDTTHDNSWLLDKWWSTVCRWLVHQHLPPPAPPPARDAPGSQSVFTKMFKSLRTKPVYFPSIIAT